MASLPPLHKYMHVQNFEPTKENNLLIDRRYSLKSAPLEPFQLKYFTFVYLNALNSSRKTIQYVYY